MSINCDSEDGFLYALIFHSVISIMFTSIRYLMGCQDFFVSGHSILASALAIFLHSAHSVATPCQRRTNLDSPHLSQIPCLHIIFIFTALDFRNFGNSTHLCKGVRNAYTFLLDCPMCFPSVAAAVFRIHYLMACFWLR